MIDKKLLDMLCCPSCNEGLRQLKNEERLNCVSCSKKYLVKDGIPVLLIDYI
jgi:uncharacterized protein YbaR (Trm112 family)